MLTGRGLESGKDAHVQSPRLLDAAGLGVAAAEMRERGSSFSSQQKLA